MILDLLFFVIGVILILGGANYLTDGAAFISYKLGLSSLAVGLTVVAFGTSMPEFVVSFTSAIKGNADIAVGNIVGSNIFNILAILGITALIKPLVVSRTTLRNEIPLMLLGFVLLGIMSLDHIFDPETSSINVISRTDSMALFCFFLVFMSYILTIARKRQAESDVPPTKNHPLWLALLFIAGGLAALIFGGNLFVDSASNLARSFGVSEAFIALTLVAGGTSLPELATSIVAARKGHVDMAIGNVVGSCLFNVFFVLGLTGIIRPISAQGITIIDLTTMIFSGLLLYIFTAFFGMRTIKRIEGALLFIFFIGYFIYLGINI